MEIRLIGKRHYNFRVRYVYNIFSRIINNRLVRWLRWLSSISRRHPGRDRKTIRVYRVEDNLTESTFAFVCRNEKCVRKLRQKLMGKGNPTPTHSPYLCPFLWRSRLRLWFVRRGIIVVFGLSIRTRPDHQFFVVCSLNLPRFRDETNGARIRKLIVFHPSAKDCAQKSRSRAFLDTFSVLYKPVRVLFSFLLNF